MIAEPGAVIGWDVGGAHLKACLVQAGGVRDVAQWPCPLWQGLDRLRHALDAARQRWPQAMGAADTRHAATMTGEMVDLFPDRACGVRALAGLLSESLGPSLRLFGGAGRWRVPQESQAAWRELASANWRATAQWVARALPEALLVDIGSTTTDLIAVREGRVCGAGDDDAARLAEGTLVYQGVVRTPLCALAQRVPFGGRMVGVMNEFFATTADVYRLTGELDAAHDQQPSADGAAKDPPATRQRLARMIGRDAADGDDDDWLALAQAWRLAQCGEITSQVERVLRRHRLGGEAPVVSAGCGDFLAESLAHALRRPALRFADLLPGLAARREDAALARWAQVAAPAAAVAMLAACGG
jgi:probable H4MPT-linked C1 transfer pathway protein